MKSRIPHVRGPIRRRIFSGLVLTAVALCSCANADRQNPVDPVNQPTLIFSQNAAFDPQRLEVTALWHWAGIPAGRYRVVRRAPRTGDVLEGDWADFLSPTDVSQGVTYTDSDLPTGEQLTYTIQVEDGTIVREFAAGSVQVPGARLETIAPSIGNVAFILRWSTAQASGASYEVVKQIENETAEVAFSTTDPSVTTWADSDISPGTAYRYWLRTILPGGAFLESSRMTAGLFVAHGQWGIQAGARGIRMRHEPVLGRNPARGRQYARSDVIAVLREDAAELRIAAYTSGGQTYGDRGEARPDVDPLVLVPGTARFDFLDSGDAHLLVAGVDAATGDIRLSAYQIGSRGLFSSFYRSAFDFHVVTRMAWHYDAWHVPDGTEVSLVTGESDIAYIAADHEIRVYNGSLGELGRVATPGGGPIDDLLVTNQRVWAAIGDDGLLLGADPLLEPGLVVVQPAWDDVSLPSGTRPIALCDLNGLVLVLDAGLEPRVLVVDEDGTVLTSWAVEELSFQRDGRPQGGLMLIDGVVWVWDSFGNVRKYEVEFTG